MSIDMSFKHWYREGSFAPFVQERRLVSSNPSWMLNICQPAGDYPDPPLHEMSVIQDLARSCVRCDFGAGRFKFEPGGIAVVPCMSATQITVDNAHNIRVLGFSPKRLSSWVESDPDDIDLGHLHRSTISAPFFHQFLDRIWHASGADQATSSLYTDAALVTLWAELLREARRPVRIMSRGGLAPWQARRCTEYLFEHANETVGLEQLAGLVGLFPFHFARAFKHTTGVPPHQYQLSLRIARAKALLEATDLSVTQIAFDVGYESSQALARLFRREVGMSPSHYRRLKET